MSSAYAARGDKNKSLSDVSSRKWDESHVRRVLAAFAYGGLTSDAQIDTWSRMRPHEAVALSNSGNFIDLMTVAASDAALARAYGHQFSRYNNNTEVFKGTDDFVREFHQLLFRINGTTENTAYHEDTTIEHTAWMLTGMNVDRNQDAYGSVNQADWYIGPIDFTNHYDEYTKPRNLRNTSLHYHGNTGEDSCLEILHSTVCDANAGEKIAELARIAGEHPESMANVPVMIIDFFADENLDASKIKEIRGSWKDAEYNLLKFIRKYATSTAFHNANTFKYRTAFDRNLLVQNMNTLDNEEVFGREYFDSPFGRMRDQGARDNLVLYFSSDFGRQLRANGDAGTDPGRGLYSILWGTDVGGGLYGEMFPEREAYPDENGKIPLETSGADVLGQTSTEKILAEVCEWMQPGSSSVVFPGAGSAKIEKPGLVTGLLSL